jgi:hypothetical protein
MQTFLILVGLLASFTGIQAQCPAPPLRDIVVSQVIGTKYDNNEGINLCIGRFPNPPYQAIHVACRQGYYFVNSVCTPCPKSNYCLDGKRALPCTKVNTCPGKCKTDNCVGGAAANDDSSVAAVDDASPTSTVDPVVVGVVSSAVTLIVTLLVVAIVLKMRARTAASFGSSA